MKLRHTLSIFVLFVTGLNICLASTSSSTSSSTASSTSAASSSSSTATSSSTPSTTLASTTTTTTSQTTTPMRYTCLKSNCSVVGCLKNITGIPTCLGKACKTEQFSNGTYYTITASCDDNCAASNCENTSSNTRTCCCKTNHCNKEIPPPSASGTSISPTLFMMLSIFLFIVVKKEL